MMRTPCLDIATPPRGGYLPHMVALRLMRFLTLFALLLAPFGMMSAHAQMAAPESAAVGHHMSAAGSSDHCGDRDSDSSDEKQRPSGIDCTIACSAVASVEATIVAHPHAAVPAPPITLAATLHGLHPESEPPPPRFA